MSNYLVSHAGARLLIALHTILLKYHFVTEPIGRDQMCVPSLPLTEAFLCYVRSSKK